MSNNINLEEENKKLLEKVNELEKELEKAKYWNDKNNIKELSITAIQRSNLINEQNKIIDKLRKRVDKLKKENEEYKNKYRLFIKKSIKRPFRKKSKFSNEDREKIKAYRTEGKTFKEIAEIFSCSPGMIHKIINE